MVPLEGGRHVRPDDAAFPSMSRADGRHADPGSEGVSGLSHGPGDYVPGVGRLPRLWSKDEGAERKPDVRPRRGAASVSGSGIFGLGVAVAVAD